MKEDYHLLLKIILPDFQAKEFKIRQLQVIVSARPGTSDNQFSFFTNNAQLNPGQEDQVYEFSSATLNYTIQSSNVMGQIVFSMNAPVSLSNVIRSGQLVKILDGADVIFEGQIIPQYVMTPISESGEGGIFLVGTLIPSIFYLTITPIIFDSSQVSQINSLLGIQVASILAGNVAQEVSTSNFLSYLISNTDYKTSFQKTIQATGLPASLFLMASAGQSRDTVFRASIDYTNTVFYQQEDGTIIVRPLDSTIKSPFALDLSNLSFGQVSNTGQSVVSMLNFSYKENGVTTPCVVSNYGLLPPNQAVAADVGTLLVSYKPNPSFYPRIQQLQNSGWFVGMILNSQINQNIVADPTTYAILQGYQSKPDQYMTSSAQSGAKENFIASYQSLLTGKQLGSALTGYSSLECTISLDDPFLPLTGMGSILGTCVDIQNCDMKSGIIAAYSRSYSVNGSFINLNIVPLGSITGYWTK